MSDTARSAFQRLVEMQKQAASDDSLLAQFEVFRDRLTEGHGSPALGSFLAIAEDNFPDSDPGKLRILDHGCGGGYDVFVLLTKGYTGTYGVDIGEKFENAAAPVNSLAKLCLGLEQDHLLKYDGRILPFPDAHFHLGYSTHVIEHVADECIEDFYEEGRRVLRDDGVRFDSFPHRLNPFDTHRKLWFIHYFPRSLQPLLYRICGEDPEYCLNLLDFRSPWFHTRRLKKLYSRYEDLTKERLLNRDWRKQGLYKGSRRFRRFLDWTLTLPIVSRVLIKLYTLVAARDIIAWS